MAQRLYLSGNPPRLITSKPGWTADPSLAETQKTFDSNWFNGCGVKFKYYGAYSTNFVYTFPYALGFVPKFLVQYGAIWNGNTSRFYYQNVGQPPYSVNPPNDVYISAWQYSEVAQAVAYTDRIQLNNTIAVLPDTRVLILVFES